MRRGKLSYWLRFGKKVTKMRSITISEKHGKICDNMKTELKIIHSRINLVSDKLGKTIKITSLHYKMKLLQWNLKTLLNLRFPSLLYALGVIFALCNDQASKRELSKSNVVQLIVFKNFKVVFWQHCFWHLVLARLILTQCLFLIRRGRCKKLL